MTAALVAHAFEVARAHAGLAFDDVRRANSAALVESWLARNDVRAPDQIEPGPQLDGLLEELVIHESYFDRDLDQLRFIDDVVLEHLAPRHAALRIWSAGCANGEEPYSLAFLLATRGILERTAILATDLSAAAIARARAGRYRAWSVRTGAETPAMRYLVRVGEELCVPERIRAHVQFARLNLVADSGPTEQHLVVCRNVLIYFEPAALAIVARKLAAALAPDGWLVVAPSDPRLEAHAELEATVTDRSVYYRRRAAAIVRPRAATPTSPPPRPRPITAKITAKASAPRVAVAVPSPIAEIRRLADRGAYEAAARVLATALVARPLDAELHFLAAVLGAERNATAALAALDRAIYLAPEAPLALLFAARLRQTRGDTAGARGAYRHALKLLEAMPPDTRVMWSDETAHGLAAACRTALEHLHD